MTHIYEQLAVPLTDLSAIPEANHLPTVRQVAEDLCTLFSRSDNDDLKRDFSSTLRAYRGSIDEAEERLLDKYDAMHWEPDRVQSYLPLLDAEGDDWNFNEPRRLHAVGAAALTVVDDAPNHPKIDPKSPNVSLVICNPYRCMGLGKMLLEKQLEAVASDFDGKAWTAVHHDNFHSQITVVKAGFEPVTEGFRNELPVILYSYQAQPS